MGGFFLWNQKITIDLNSVRNVFKSKGFNSPSEFILGDARLLLYPKQMHSTPQTIKLDSGQELYLVGSMGYKRLSFQASIKTLLQDAVAGSIDWKELIGSFAGLIWDGNQILLLNDRLHVQPVFHNRLRTVFSTSFLAMVAAGGKQQKLNRMALLEKISTGYIVSPDTLVEGIFKITDEYSENEPNPLIRLSRSPVKMIESPPTAAELSLEDCIQQQKDSLCQYMIACSVLEPCGGTVIGASAGYDSRLLLAAAMGRVPGLMLQTHATEGVHDEDRRIVGKWADERGLRLIVVPTRPLRKLAEHELDQIADECVSFFDGRNSHNMGSLSEVYTRRYSISSLGEAGLRLNGLGGELYRNYYFSARRRLDLFQWMQHHVYYPPSKMIIGDSGKLGELHDYVMGKVFRMLNERVRSEVDQFFVRRYYSEVRMPECDAVNSNAHNQVAYYLMPFIEWEIIRAGYRALPHIGFSGKFQARLIASFDAQLAETPSHYGFPLLHEPLSWQVKAIIKGSIPDALWNRRLAKQMHSSRAGNRRVSFIRELDRNPMLKESVNLLRGICSGMDIDAGLLDYAQGPNVLFIAFLINRLSRNLSL